ncbi:MULTISPECIES: hypothetical protein [unclassified Pseudomonas]|uniref:hypothetical protein n=1 Tax=unclassified Pseudomonas TaxID=196821 RepID=UPI0011BEA335|nr:MULTISPECIES: hypothetical protein [unclassified Pseudomonas]
MNIFHSAAKACRVAFRALLAASSHALSRLTLDRCLDLAARTLCVQSGGVMVCGASSASVAHFASPCFSKPRFSRPPNSR